MNVQEDLDNYNTYRSGLITMEKEKVVCIWKLKH